jgi:hypothetical protein
MNETFSLAPGGQVASYQPHGFGQVFGIWVNNFSGGWLGVDGQNLWVPPYTRGWKATVFPGTSSVTVRSYDFANGNVIAGATGQAAQVTLWSEPQGDNEGIAFFDAQTVPTVMRDTNTVPVTGIMLLPAPAVGRYRIYEVGIYYLNPAVTQAWTYDGVIGQLGSATRPHLTTLSISPASPMDRIVLAQPQGDLAIGESLQYSFYDVEDALGGVNGLIGVYARYAVI